MTISHSALFRRTPTTLSAAVAEDFVALNVHRGTCFGMADVSAVVWSMLEDPVSLDDVVERLLGDYEVEETQCRTEVGDLIEVMIQEGVVESAQ